MYDIFYLVGVIVESLLLKDSANKIGEKHSFVFEIWGPRNNLLFWGERRRISLQ